MLIQIKGSPADATEGEKVAEQHIMKVYLYTVYVYEQTNRLVKYL